MNPRTSKNGSQHDQAGSTKEVKLYRFEFTGKRIAFYSAGLVIALSWMFVLGVLVGRGVSLVKPDDISLRGAFFRFIGLGSRPEPVPEDVAETWDPQKVLESLSYYEDLTQKSVSVSTAVKQANGAAAHPKADPKEQTQKPNQSTNAVLPQGMASPATEKPAASQSVESQGGAYGEHFTLLVGSLRDAGNAQRMVEQLKTKGYPVRLDTIDLSAGGRWNRVLVGSFASREEALRFAADFNRKEHMEGLVVREVR